MILRACTGYNQVTHLQFSKATQKSNLRFHQNLVNSLKLLHLVVKTYGVSRIAWIQLELPGLGCSKSFLRQLTDLFVKV